ncbi:uncharacterized protein PHACADRAFT_194128 [Phanerochaete carnosa HHB-10118-sp]|uniref:RING-type domain-containing protein n=1 Tax=Phanerochaete carnosa (strain HHB-10118-sp) TaxID=650164 RepID=K5WC09_PHACS|nr:uncharacterized protein PHACADRAFT_194128 [Phanerochaete carnosa HHB-10118-sp]EKM56524.1 hypothetical protein PHACADRAFT_194128 [Phanerochaete carnosa HHB-10118-sp]
MFTSVTHLKAHYRRDHPCRNGLICHIAAQKGMKCPIHSSDEGDDASSGASPVVDVDTQRPEPDVATFQAATMALEQNKSSAEPDETDKADPTINIPLCSLIPSELVTECEKASEPATAEDKSPLQKHQVPTLSESATSNDALPEHSQNPSTITPNDGDDTEDTSSGKHASMVPDDWECTPSSAVSDCSDSWTEIASVFSEGDAVQVNADEDIPKAESATAEEFAVAAVEDSVKKDVDAAHEADLNAAQGEGAADEASTGETQPAQLSLPRIATEAPTEPQARLMILSCKVCTKNPTNPVVTMCGHVFCHGCILNALGTSLSCPACNRPILVRLDL